MHRITNGSELSASIHAERATDARWNTCHLLKTSESSTRKFRDELLCRSAAPCAQCFHATMLVVLNALECRSIELDDNAIYACVRDQQIRAAPEHTHRNLIAVASSHQYRERCNITRRDEYISLSSDAVPRECRKLRIRNCIDLKVGVQARRCCHGHCCITRCERSSPNQAALGVRTQEMSRQSCKPDQRPS